MNVIERIFLSASTFRSKQLLVIMMACSIVLTTALTCILAYNYYFFREESRERLGAMAQIISSDLGAALVFDDEKAIGKTLAALKGDQSIKQLFVLDGYGQISGYYHKNSDVTPDDLRQRLTILQSETPWHYFSLSLQIDRPIILDGNRVGTILIEQDGHTITQKISASTGIGVTIWILSLGLSFLLANRFQQIITEPVTDMANAMREVSYSKDYSKRVNNSGTDEMDQLAQGFNEMLSEIELRDMDLLERQKQLYNMANFDALTSLANRTLFNDRLQQALLRATRTGEKLAILFIDLDNFKDINDTFGHRTGDQLLLETATRLRANTRADDTLARLGGDEFIIFLHNIQTPDNALFVARKHLDSLCHCYLIDDNRMFVSASIGVALFPEHGTSAENLIKNADSAMYLAKETGKNSVIIFTDSLHVKLSEKSGLSNDLHDALENGEFELYYQPRINLMQNSWTSAEALIRWNHPKLGIVSPDKFIAIAEHNGMILPIGEWVIREACRQLRLWHCQGFHLPRISVNVSSLQLQRQDLISIVKDALTSNNLCTQALELEIVESALVVDLVQSTKILTKLQNIGVKISIDDFGTGYSSLSYLRTLPIDILKIDRSFLRHIHERKGDEKIFAAIIAMALSLELGMVSEGVECAEQELVLKKYKCHEVQGYYYARPMPADELFQRFTNSQVRLEDVRLQSDTTKSSCCFLTSDTPLRCGEGPALFCRSVDNCANG